MRRLAALGLVMAGAAVLAFFMWPGDRLARETQTAARPVASATYDIPPFAAGKDRLFLTLAESAEAARRGLAPAGARSIIRTGGALGYGEWRWDEEGVPRGPVAVRVDLGRQLVSVYRGPDEIGTAVILYGAKGKETPVGRLPILGKSRHHHSRTYDAPMPYSLWLRDDGVAVHGTNVKAGRASNGCIGVPVEFAAKLFDVVAKGDIIEVIGADNAAAGA